MKTRKHNRTAGPARLAGLVLLATLAGTPAVSGQTDASPATAEGEEIFARVGDDVITRQKLEGAVTLAMRKKFYHFQPPEAERQSFRREVAHNVVTRTLLLQEAARRGLKADHDRVRQQLDSYERRYSNSERWQTEGEKMLEAVGIYLRQADQLRQLEQQVRAVALPTEQQIQEYYAAHPDKFTEPVRQRVSLILLTVDPSATSLVWQATLDEGAKLVSQLRAGADFSELARLHSGDSVSAEKGGDMGYLHQGMLGAGAEETLEALEIGAIPDPIRLLEGVAIFRVDDRIEPKLLPLSEVRVRARELWSKEQSDAAWSALEQRLWEITPVEIYDPALAPSIEKQTSMKQIPSTPVLSSHVVGNSLRGV